MVRPGLAEGESQVMMLAQNSATVVEAPRPYAPMPRAIERDFAAYNNRFAGGCCYVVGRGPTRFDYRYLAEVREPMFFINDAVSLARLARSETFFFAHDLAMRVWLDGSVKSTAVLPINGTVLGSPPATCLGHTGPVVYYRRQDEDREALMRMNRDQLAEARRLFGHSGTIHSLLHFVWYCGFRKISYIGCEGVNEPSSIAQPIACADGYDIRLPNKSKTRPGWNYDRIRRVQDLLTSLLGIETVHLGSPPRDGG
jgi:hypothetical protein